MMFGMGAQGTGANRLQRSRVAQHGTAERIFPMDLGSGRAHDRERDRERRPRFGVQQPGPETASDWSDALEDIFGRIRGMSSSLASHAHELAEGAADWSEPTDPGGREFSRPPNPGRRRAHSGAPGSNGSEYARWL